MLPPAPASTELLEILPPPARLIASLAVTCTPSKHYFLNREYVSAGTGTVGNLLTEYVAMKEKIKLVHVPYRSGNGAILDLIAGRVKVGMLNWSTAQNHHWWRPQYCGKPDHANSTQIRMYRKKAVPSGTGNK